MPEYIEREAVCEYCGAKEIDACSDECAILNTPPTADVAPVRHGRWEWYVDPSYDLYNCYRCSECHVWAGTYGVDDDVYEEPPTDILHYCPNCGAKMDGKGDG